MNKGRKIFRGVHESGEVAALACDDLGLSLKANCSNRHYYNLEETFISLTCLGLAWIRMLLTAIRQQIIIYIL